MTPAGGGAARLQFRPDIEGLRAIAVGIVVAVHAGCPWVSGGYVGVDVFFVISGFLITSLLVREVATSGRVSVLAFYARRARRILPAACFVLAVTVVATYWVLGPLAGKTAALDGRWASAFSANLRFMRQGTDYFASGQSASPLQHYWSLAVEEQFYLVWPTLLFALVAIGRSVHRSALALRVGLVVLVAASLAWSVHETAVAPASAYFSPFTRAWELGVGALVAVFPTAIERTPAALRAVATWAGLGAIAYATYAFSASTAFPGAAAAIPVLGTALVIAGGAPAPRGGAAGILGFRPLRWLGRISFSLYLWHWPVLIIAQERSSTPLTGLERAVCVGVAVVLASLTFSFIEDPIRNLGKRRRPPLRARPWMAAKPSLIAGATAIGVAVLATAMIGYDANLAIARASRPPTRESSLGDRLTRSTTSGVQPVGATPTTSAVPSGEQPFITATDAVAAVVASGARLRSIPATVDPPPLRISDAKPPQVWSCLNSASTTSANACVRGDTHASATIALYGDSHAVQWVPALDVVAQQRHMRLVVFAKGACPVPALRVVYPFGPREYSECDSWRTSAVRQIVAMRPALLILSYDPVKPVEGGNTDAQWTSAFTTSLQQLRPAGAPIVELGITPELSQDPGICLTRPGASPGDCSGVPPNPRLIDRDRDAVRATGGTFIDVSHWFCTKATCPVIIDNRIAYFDHGHISDEYAADLAPVVGAALTYILSSAH